MTFPIRILDCFNRKKPIREKRLGRRRQQGMQARKHDIYDDYGCRRSGLLTGHYSRRVRDMAPVTATFENAVIMKSWR